MGTAWVIDRNHYMDNPQFLLFHPHPFKPFLMSFLCLRQGASTSWCQVHPGKACLSLILAPLALLMEQTPCLSSMVLSDSDSEEPAQDFSQALEELIPRAKLPSEAG